jgi:4-hydroxy-4-methyl-2-oxoglutarate aldolase
MNGAVTMASDRVDPQHTTAKDIIRVFPALVAEASSLSAATLHEAAGRTGVMPTDIKPLRDDWTLCGPVYTVQSPGGDNLWLHRAIYAANPGDILVVHTSGVHDFGYWGEVMATAAIARGLAGLVIDGGVRDVRLLREMLFPVFSRGITIRGTGKDFGARGWLGAPTMFEGLVVNSGDLLFGDCDGVVVIPRERVRETIDASVAREQKEAAIMERLKKGETTLDLFGLN